MDCSAAATAEASAPLTAPSVAAKAVSTRLPVSVVPIRSRPRMSWVRLSRSELRWNCEPITTPCWSKYPPDTA